MEWPPSPWRLLRGLLSVGFTHLHWASLPDEAESLIDKSSGCHPRYALPDGVPVHTRHYMPVHEGAKIKSAKIFDTAIRVVDRQMAWLIDRGSWRTVLSSPTYEFATDPLCSSMADWLAVPPQLGFFEEIGDNLTLSPSQFRSLAKANLNKASNNVAVDRTVLDFLAAFGSEATWQPHAKDRGLIQDTALRTMSGAGHQHFIKFMREIIANTTAQHLVSTLFAAWTYEDEGRGMNLRWDPIDDRRYAMRWKNPSSDPAVTMRGANRLAIEALSLFTTAPSGNDLHTTGFRTQSRRGTFWSWPIWEPAIPLETIRTLLQHPQLTDGADQRGQASLIDKRRLSA